MNKLAYYKIMSGIFAFASIITLGLAVIFAGFGEAYNGMFCLAITLCTAVLSALYRELAKPKHWSPYRMGDRQF